MILVTGGCGFIGSAITKQLLKEGFPVRVFDLAEQFEQNLPSKEAEVYKGSILDINDLTNAMKGCNQVIHLAAMMGVRNTDNRKLECLRINLQGTVNVLEACVRDKVEKIVFSSSSEVYGEQAKNPIAETNPLSPKSIYAITKIAAEEYIKAYSQRYGLHYSIVRFFNVFGVMQSPEFVMPRFTNAVYNDLQPEVYGKGSQIRSFCYVDDAAKGAIFALKSDAADNEVFNIGNDSEPISMAELAKKIIKISGKKMQPKFVSYKESDRTAEREISKRIPDITKAKRVLGYEPSVSLEDGITKILRGRQNG